MAIPFYSDSNDVLMENGGGAALLNLRVCHGKRLSIFRTYVHPCLAQPNLTVLTGALVTRVLIEGKRAVGVEAVWEGKPRQFAACRETILSPGAIHTPKVLMQSGLGDHEELSRHDIDIVEHLPGVGANLQDHRSVAGCIWEYNKPLPRNNLGEAAVFWKSNSALDSPDIQTLQENFLF